MADTRKTQWLEALMTFAGQPILYEGVGKRLADFFIDNEWASGAGNEMTIEDLQEAGLPHLVPGDMAEIYGFIKALTAFLDSDLSAAQIEAATGAGDSWRKKLNQTRLSSNPFRQLA